MDDATFTAEGPVHHRRLCPLGDGVLDWPGMLATLDRLAPQPQLWVDLHKGQYDIYLFDRPWLDGHPDLTLHEYAAVARTAITAARAISPDEVRRLENAQVNPHSRLAPALAATASWA